MRQLLFGLETILLKQNLKHHIIRLKINLILLISNKHRKNDFAERFEILLDIDLKIILLDHQNNFGTLKIMSVAAKNFDILATSIKRSTKLF